MTLSRHIRLDLHERIRADHAIPEPFTLASIASAYGVSLMPVRSALEQLIDDGVIIKHDNGRLSVSPDARDTQADFDPPEPPGDGFAPIRSEIIWRSLRGESEFIRLAEIADRYPVGRTKAQSILQKLSREGLIEHHARRGWRIRPFSSNDLDAYLDARIAIELTAFDLAHDRFDEAHIKSLLDHNRAAGKNRPAQLDDSLHGYWMQLADNRYLCDFHERTGRFYGTLYRNAVIGEPLVSRLARQHRAILNAILDRDRDAARGALERDIRSLKPILDEAAAKLAKAKSPDAIAHPADHESELPLDAPRRPTQTSKTHTPETVSGSTYR